MLGRTFIISLAALSAVAIGSPTVAAQQFPGSSWAPQGNGGERVQEVDLPTVLRGLQRQYGGRHVGAERRGQRYEIIWIAGDGRRLVIKVDVRTGKTISVRG